MIKLTKKLKKCPACNKGYLIKKNNRKQNMIMKNPEDLFNYECNSCGARFNEAL